MIRPLRVSVPWDSQPMSGGSVGASAVVRNGATGLNIPAYQFVEYGQANYFQTSDWVMCSGYDTFSLVYFVGTESRVEALLVPVSACDPNIWLAPVSLGVMEHSTVYQSLDLVRAGMFGFYLRFVSAIDPEHTASLDDIRELQMYKA